MVTRQLSLLPLLLLFLAPQLLAARQEGRGLRPVAVFGPQDAPGWAAQRLRWPELCQSTLAKPAE